ncbi:hypothetical protein PSPO01_02347 [Paraphaeosphaeria sporulosa]
MPPYNLRPHPKPANPTDDTRKRVKQSKQSKRQKDMQAINMERGLLSLLEMTRYNLRAQPKPASSACGVQKQTKPTKRQKENKLVSVRRSFLSLWESSVRLESRNCLATLMKPTPLTLAYQHLLRFNRVALTPSTRRDPYEDLLCPCLKHGGSCRSSYATHLSFIRVCRQNYNEASMIHCARNNFHVCVSLGCDVVGVLADSLRKGQLQALRHLEFPASEVVSELCWRQHLHKNWNDRLFDDMSLTELFPNLKSVTVEDFDTEYHRNRGQRVLRRSATSSSVYPDVREMLLGGCKDGVELVLPEWMSRYLGSA